jgi:uncharacterized protein
MHRLLTPADYRRIAWKNGGGSTMEITVHPPRADFERFAWRASLADIARDSPFSVFPGVDRTLVMVRGAGMRLTGTGEPLEVRALYEPVAFAGELALECTLHDGPVRDFNLMVRRGVARGAIVVVREEAGTIGPARFRLCYAAAGSCECLLAGNVPLTLPDGHALLIDAEEATPPALHVNPLSADAVALVASADMIEAAA